ncbi:hypothetical protein CSUNSWCD_2023 [Campylobacter showae CSUNSWCD]|uniref:Uncharacterized protein n=1 Tax=Campylobacter showae CSUNSWCD TaxID=1244083 RepID=M5IG14_9BACT|nr:hypothetical protein CSUNSWCD_2023 [Campylobacter showae CSUNSWCD]
MYRVLIFVVVLLINLLLKDLLTNKRSACQIQKYLKGFVYMTALV